MKVYIWCIFLLAVLRSPLVEADSDDEGERFEPEGEITCRESEECTSPRDHDPFPDANRCYYVKGCDDSYEKFKHQCHINMFKCLMRLTGTPVKLTPARPEKCGIIIGPDGTRVLDEKQKKSKAKKLWGAMTGKFKRD